MDFESQQILERIVSLIISRWETDAVYLYGSRAKGTARPDSDWDIAVLFRDFLTSPVERCLRPQQVEEILQRELHKYDRISVVDLEDVPPPLQISIITGKRIYDRGVPHVRRIEQSVISKIEKDYEYRPRSDLRA
jgi:uncharacterized protein